MQRAMRNVRARYALIAACAAWLVSPDEVAAQPRRRITDLPPDPIVAATEWWGATDRRFEHMRYKELGPDDIELRFWAGYGLVGTRGIFMLRKDREWRAWRVDVKRCAVSLPPSVADTLSETSENRYLQQARRDCDARKRDTLSVASVLSSDTLDAIPVSDSGLADVWTQLVTVGIATLPTSVHRSQMMTDGHTYVVQLRMGQEYRVSRIEQWHVVETPADKAIQRINAILTQRIGWVAGDNKR